MKVILQQDVKGLGKKGEIVNASDGYARNFLIPKKMAIYANDGNVHTVEQQKKAQEKRKAEERQAAEELKERIEKVTVTMKTKAGEGGRLFGSVTNKEIAEALQKQHKIKIDKRKINLSDPIKNLGDTVVEVKVYPNVSASMKVKVQAE
ncbi:LSU ribosomal protein L9P [Tindallia magadiensis]|uniref:Large ribosomal subunit protein bL9 n=1 Tax=Tindallia magadiensis TaxID=69895 RepID=A0A1I3GGA6_9FIRM|nr:50S ribosomal protein L9 [Tindallia magadiensis]SFI22473.1 LSU ribosomal protein L9P [Tindallia magadiensis]